jgi:hypothetical protein
MKFKPVSEQEADAQSANLWPDGEYDFEVKVAEEKEAKSGNDMFALELWIFDDGGGRKNVFDYLVLSEKSAWKLRHFASSCGMILQYEGGAMMAGEMEGRTGRCTIGTQPAKDGYAAKNVVRGYVKASGAAPVTQRPPAQRVKAPAGDIDDEIPF